MVNTTEVLHELRQLFAMTRHEPMHRMRIAELFEILDESLSNEGYLPEDWRGAKRSEIRTRYNRPTIPPTNEGIRAKYSCDVCPERFRSALALADHALSRGH